MTGTPAPTMPAMAPGSRPLEWDGELVLVLEFAEEAEVEDSVPAFSGALAISDSGLEVANVKRRTA